MHLGFLLIEGNHTDRLADIYQVFDLTSPVEELTQQSLDAASERTYSEIHTVKAASFINGWTVILDFDLTLCTADDQLPELAKVLGARVFTVLAESCSDSYGFALYQPEKVRYFLSTESEITDNYGAPLPVENGINLAEIDDDGITQLMRAIGVDNDSLDELKYLVHIFEDENPVAAYVTANPAKSSEPPKPWWKFW